VLGRTVNALRPYALAAAAAGVRISGPDELFDAAGAQETLEAYFTVLSVPGHATEADVRVILRRPSRGLGQDAAERICRGLAAGDSLPEAIERPAVNASEQWRVVKAAEGVSVLVAIEDAAALIGRLRADGLDQHFVDAARASARPDRDDLTVLDDAQREAAGKTVAQYAAILSGRRLALRKARDDRNGIELTTVHRAKGRQWPRVVVVACDEDVLPHRNALQEPEELGEGVEAERRIAYVAFTRATTELSILYTSERPSRFPHEAGLIAAPPKLAAPAAPTSRAGFWPRKVPSSADALVQRAHEVGLHHALTVVADRQAALEFAAVALRHDLAGPATRSEQLTVRQFLKAISGLSRSERQRVQRAVPGLDSGQLVAKLPPATRDALAATLRVVARRSRCFSGRRCRWDRARARRSLRRGHASAAGTGSRRAARCGRTRTVSRCPSPGGTRSARPWTPSIPVRSRGARAPAVRRS
jgi:UvrD-like helicase family protein